MRNKRNKQKRKSWIFRAISFPNSCQDKSRAWQAHRLGRAPLRRTQTQKKNEDMEDHTHDTRRRGRVGEQSCAHHRLWKSEERRLHESLNRNLQLVRRKENALYSSTAYSPICSVCVALFYWTRSGGHVSQLWANCGYNANLKERIWGTHVR